MALTMKKTFENLINTVHSIYNSTTEIKKKYLKENLTQHIHGTLTH